VVAPLMPNPWAAWVLMAVAFAAMIGIGSPSQHTVIQTITPNELRGKITAFWLLIYSVMGFSVAPVVVAMITDYVLQDESQIRWALFWVALVFGTLSLALSWLGMKPYAREVARLKSLE
jgi:MFS family permease